MLASGEFGGNKYDVVSRSFRDTIQIFVHKNSKISKVFRCQLTPLAGGAPLTRETEIILPGITPEPLVGTSLEDASGSLYASLIASLVSRQSPDEARVVIIGLGAVGPRSTTEIGPDHREELLFVTKLVQKSCVW